MNIINEFKVAVSRDPFLTYRTWQINRDKIFKHTYASIALAWILASISFLLLALDMALVLLCAGGFVLLMYAFNNAVFVAASKKKDDTNANRSSKGPMGRYEYLDMTINPRKYFKSFWVGSRYPTSAIFFVLPYVLYVLCVVFVLMLVLGLDIHF